VIRHSAESANLVGETKVEPSDRGSRGDVRAGYRAAAKQISRDAPPTQTIMSQLSLRTNPENPNHHLWNNNGTWFIHYVVHPTPITKERIRRSLGTKSLAEARAKRDAIFTCKSGAQEQVRGLQLAA
jgi:hypothetical protein